MVDKNADFFVESIIDLNAQNPCYKTEKQKVYEQVIWVDSTLVFVVCFFFSRINPNQIIYRTVTNSYQNFGIKYDFGNVPLN